ncbi:MAG: alpha-amylase family glycosyl hydrolase, partial [Spirulinaceae cyanobacterium]
MSYVNGTMMQFFHWYYPSDGTLWTEVKQKATELAQAGVTALWLPPAYKGGSGGYDTGYGVYDLFDLGEFDQKGTIRTKYGTKEEFLTAVKAAQQAGVQIYADIVLNHKDSADETEEVYATAYYENNRNYRVMSDGKLEKIQAYTKFTFPGRGDKYSSMKWHWWHFDSVVYNNWRPGEYPSKIYLFEGKGHDDFVNLEKGNYDFLLGCDLDMQNDQVRKELDYWG